MSLKTSNVNILCRPFAWIISGPKSKKPTVENIKDYCINNNVSAFGKCTPLEYLGLGGFLEGLFLSFTGNKNGRIIQSRFGLGLSFAGIISGVVGLLGRAKLGFTASKSIPGISIKTEKIFSDKEKELFSRYKDQIDEMEKKGLIRFIGEEHISRKKEIKDRLAFEFVYLGIKEESLQPFNLEWNHVAKDFQAIAYAYRNQKYDYGAALNIDRMIEEKIGLVSLEQGITSENRHIAQHYLRDTLGLDKFPLYKTEFLNCFYESSEHINNIFYEWLENPTVKIDSFFNLDVKLPEDEKSVLNQSSHNAHYVGQYLSREIISNIARWWDLIKENPGKYFRAYSQILALVDFSSVASEANVFNNTIKNLIVNQNFENINRLEELIDRNTFELRNRGYDMVSIKDSIEKMKKKIQAGEIYCDMQLFTLALGGMPGKEQVITEEYEYAVKIMEQIIAIQSPEELLKVAEEAMKAGRYSLIARPMAIDFSK